MARVDLPEGSVEAAFIAPDGTIIPLPEGTADHSVYLYDNKITDIPPPDDAEYEDTFKYDDNAVNDFDAWENWKEATIHQAKEKGYQRTRNWTHLGDESAQFGIDTIDTNKAITPERMAELYKLYNIPEDKVVSYEFNPSHNDFKGNLAEYMKWYELQNRRSNMAQLLKDKRFI